MLPPHFLYPYFQIMILELIALPCSKVTFQFMLPDPICSCLTLINFKQLGWIFMFCIGTGWFIQNSFSWNNSAAAECKGRKNTVLRHFQHFSWKALVLAGLCLETWNLLVFKESKPNCWKCQILAGREWELDSSFQLHVTRSEHGTMVFLTCLSLSLNTECEGERRSQPRPFLHLPQQSPLLHHLEAFCLLTYLHGQADGVQQDQNEHQVFEIGGVDHIPNLVLVLVFRDVSPQGPGFQGILYTLALWERQATFKTQTQNIRVVSYLQM